MTGLILSTQRKDIDCTDMQDRTLLSWAAERGDASTLSLLLRRGADPNKADNKGWGPLIYALRAKAVSCANLLLEAGAGTNIPDAKGCLPLNLSPSIEVAECLLNFGARVDGVDNYVTPLHTAIQEGNVDIIQLLLAKGASCGMEDVEFSIRYDRWMVLKLLLHHMTNDIQRSTSVRFDFGVFYEAAASASAKTLKVLASQWPSNYDESYKDSGGHNAQDIAELRRDRNPQWSDWVRRPPDKDPEAWYQEFEAMVASIEARHPTKREADCSEDSDNEVDNIDSDANTTSQGSEDENGSNQDESEAESQISGDHHQDIHDDPGSEEDGASSDVWEDAREALD